MIHNLLAISLLPAMIFALASLLVADKITNSTPTVAKAALFIKLVDLTILIGCGIMAGFLIGVL